MHLDCCLSHAIRAPVAEISLTNGVSRMESNRNLMRSIVRLMRPNQWIKNGFVLMPLIFSGRMFVPQEAFLAAGATIGFCLGASVIDVSRKNSQRPKKLS
jgi:hypothetical protein